MALRSRSPRAGRPEHPSVNRTATFVPMNGKPAEGSALLRNPMAPGIVVWLLLVIANVLTLESTAEKTVPLAVIGCVFVALFVFGRRVRVPLPKVPPRDVLLLFVAGWFVLAFEAAYFGGLPLFGQVAYNKFGLPILHHVVFSMWVVPLLAPRRAALYLAGVLLAAALMFNRQMMLLALIGYLMRAGARRVFVPMVVAASLVVLGSLRNTLHDVQEVVRQSGELVTGPLGSLLFWGYLYVLGPYMVTMGGDAGAATAIEVSDYWNTVPDWAVFTNVGFAPEWSLALFYPAVALVVVLLSRSRSFEGKAFGAIIHVMCFVTFFSNTLLSTPVIGSILVVAFLRRMQQYGRPQSRPEPVPERSA